MLWRSNKSASHSGRIGTLIGPGTRIDGKVTFSGGMRVDGTIVGAVTDDGGEPGTLVVGAQGSVDGEVRVARIILDGRIKGEAHARDLIDLRNGARVAGDLHYGRLEIHAGAAVDGRLVKRNGETSGPE